MSSAADDTNTELLQVTPCLANELRGGSALAIPPLDLARYRNELGELDLNVEQQAELLLTLYFIMATFVDWGFGVDSVHRVLPALADFSSENAANTLEESGSADSASVPDTKKGLSDE